MRMVNDEIQLLEEQIQIRERTEKMVSEKDDDLIMDL